MRIVGEYEIWDPQLKTLAYGDLTFAHAARRVLDRAIASADVVVMTLGMTETWYDEQIGAVLQTPQHPFQIKRFPDCFSFFNADFHDVSAALQPS